MSTLASRHLFTARMETTPQVVGAVPMGFHRRAGILTGGSFCGERLRGRVLPGGGDWLIQRPDGALHLDVRCMLETDQGEIIYMTYTGRRTTSPEVARRLARGEPVAAEDMYFRTAVQFETASPRLIWLNDVIAVGVGSRPPVGPVYDVFEII
ncbi:DUF3237 domain-containing protein [Chelatococcus reniformis]|uniref:UPF0311 protein GCM10010994_40440 n=1 Tax=Chelatococcus reniformis TaxID=1494448 RepID=A0A916XKS9_9HYPH|nr:DUF3237 domain-containing protein [Chelatococcus reniformis]GGC78111.1 UPF0311 protein [Chelatococcus reniformis]